MEGTRARAGPGKQAVSAGCLREWMEQSAIKRAKNMNMPYLFDFLARSLARGRRTGRQDTGRGDRRTERPSRFGMSRMRHGQRRRNGKRWHACNDRREGGGGKASFCALDLQLQPNGL